MSMSLFKDQRLVSNRGKLIFLYQLSISFSAVNKIKIKSPFKGQLTFVTFLHGAAKFTYPNDSPSYFSLRHATILRKEEPAS